jgi:hypothetical protein
MPATIEMNNDGGWCAIYSSTFLAITSTTVATPLHIGQAPAHGQVMTTKMQQSTRVAYKPDPGFTGADKFSFVDETFGTVREVDVTVIQ